MTNEQATELLALMADQIKATDRLADSFERRFTQLNETMLNGFVRMEDKFDHLTGRVDHLTGRVDHLTGRVDHLTGRVDHLTDEVKEIKVDIQDIKAEGQTTNRRLQATFEHAGFLTEENSAKEARLVKLETTNADMLARISKLEE